MEQWLTNHVEALKAEFTRLKSGKAWYKTMTRSYMSAMKWLISSSYDHRRLQAHAGYFAYSYHEDWTRRHVVTSI